MASSDVLSPPGDILFQKPQLATIMNANTEQEATSQNSGSSIIDPSIILTFPSAAETDAQLWSMQRVQAGSDKWTIQNNQSSGYARPQGTPANDTSVVEGADSYQWQITSADDGSGHQLIAAFDKSGNAYYWGIPANSADRSDIKLRTDQTDDNNHWIIRSPTNTN